MIENIALTDQQAAEVCDILRSVLMQSPIKTPESTTVKVWVFGSRATGRARPYSDLDILISSPTPLDWRARADLQDAFEASNLPFRVDVVEEARLAPDLAPRVLAERQNLPI
jgi:predicted nucleotidyltransferase